MLSFSEQREVYPYDGRPDLEQFVNAQGLGIQTYRWMPRSGRVDAVAVFFHGVKAHTRLALLSKGGVHFREPLNLDPTQFLFTVHSNASVCM